MPSGPRPARGESEPPPEPPPGAQGDPGRDQDDEQGDASDRLEGRDEPAVGELLDHVGARGLFRCRQSFTSSDSRPTPMPTSTSKVT